jgi:5'-3' exonuclease
MNRYDIALDKTPLARPNMNHLIVDGFNLAFRAHHAFLTLQTNKGLSSGCVYGFLTTLRNVKNKYPDCHITIAWDTESTRRKASDPTYKANRPKFELSEQIQDLKNIMGCLNVSQVEYPGEEADDCIASLVKKYSDEKNQVFVYTSDKDMLQLVRDGRVIVIKPKVGIHPERIFDEAGVKEVFGVGPRDLECYQSFKGDSVDNIPGVPRIKTACLVALIEKYKTPQNIYAHLEEEKLTDFQRQSLKDSEQRVYLNSSLVRLRDDLEFNIKKGIINEENLTLLLDKYEIKSISPMSYVNVFVDATTFNKRTAPAVVTPSLFEEGAL